jgi:S-adenosylmethionine synthetase
MRTAEFLSPNNPNKLCDRIADSILDVYLKQDPTTQCNIQVSGGYGKVFVYGDVASDGDVSNQTIQEIVYDISEVDNVEINLFKHNHKTNINNQSGIVIGYATKETETFMPFEYELARDLNKFIYSYHPYDGTTQITINGDWLSVVASFQNTTSTQLDNLIREYFKDKKYHIDKIYCNNSGDWNVGGLIGNSGSNGKEIVVDNYGPRIPIGGSSYSGKDFFKIERCAGYMARRIAVDSLTKYGLHYALVELSYANGQDEPVQARIKGNDSGINIETGLHLFEVKEYDLTPNGIIDFLELHNTNYHQTSLWGHMGNNFKWK